MGGCRRVRRCRERHLFPRAHERDRRSTRPLEDRAQLRTPAGMSADASQATSRLLARCRPRPTPRSGDRRYSVSGSVPWARLSCSAPAWALPPTAHVDCSASCVLRLGIPHSRSVAAGVRRAGDETALRRAKDAVERSIPGGHVIRTGVIGAFHHGMSDGAVSAILPRSTSLPPSPRSDSTVQADLLDVRRSGRARRTIRLVDRLAS